MRYAKQLCDDDIDLLAYSTEGMSGRNISDICKGSPIKADAERRWASKLIRNETEQKLPMLDQYLNTIDSRKT